MARCNLPEEERRPILENYEHWGPDAEDLDKCKDFFDQFLFIESPEWDRKKKIVTCSYCEQASCVSKEEGRSIMQLKHGEAANCPMCGHNVTVQQLGRISRGHKLYQKAAVSFINVSTEGEVYMESGIAFDDYYCDYDYGEARPQMNISFIGKKRYYFRQGAVMEWKRRIGNEYQRNMYGIGGWEETVNITEPFSENPIYGFDGYGYVVGFERLANSDLRYSAIDRHYAEYHKRDIYERINPLRFVPQYLAEYAICPKIEMAVKMGMCDVVGELVKYGRKNAKDINWKAKTPYEFVRLKKKDAKEFFNNPSLDILKWLHKAEKIGMDAKKAMEIVGNIGIPSERLLEYCGKYDISLRKIAMRYKSKNAAEIWVDYIENSEALNYDLSREDVLLPKAVNLREKHDEAVKNRNILTDQKKNDLYREKRKKELEKKYSFAMDGLCIVVPDGIDSIVEEGKTLKICVGGYANRHVEGATTILFLRHVRRKERSYICIELTEAGKIRQIHGYANEHIWDQHKHLPDPAIRYKSWLDTWQSWIKDGSKRDKQGNPIIKERKTA